MKQFTLSIYFTVNAKNEEEAQKIADNIAVTTKLKEDEHKIEWDSFNLEIDEELE